MLEGKTIEFKREYMDDIKYAWLPLRIQRGKFYIGINDDGTVCGVSDVDQSMLKLTNMIRDVGCPNLTMFTDCTVEQMDGKKVIVLTVQCGTARPYYMVTNIRRCIFRMLRVKLMEIE